MATRDIRESDHTQEEPLELIVPDGLTRDMAEEAANFLAALREGKQGLQLVASVSNGDSRRESVILPQLAVDMLAQLLTEMGRGHAVVVEPVEAELTTQQAADILNVSRPYLIGLLDEGKIPYRKVGNRRKISLTQLLDYKRRDDKHRDAIANEIASETQNIGIDYPDFEILDTGDLTSA